MCLIHTLRCDKQKPPLHSSSNSEEEADVLGALWGTDFSFTAWLFMYQINCDNNPPLPSSSKKAKRKKRSPELDVGGPFLVFPK